MTTQQETEMREKYNRMMVEKYFTVRCICTVCNRPQVRKVGDIVSSAKCCLGGGLAHKPPCNGELNYYVEDMEDAAGNAYGVLGYLPHTVLANRNDKLAELVDAVTDDLGRAAEGEQTPQQMGWAGQNGLP